MCRASSHSGMYRCWILVLLSALALATCALARAGPCVPFLGADWMTTVFAADPGTAAARPIDCAQVQQNPPEFGWPYVNGAEYALSLTFPDGHVESRASDRNWFNWGATLPAGDYSWSVTQNGLASRARRFSVDAGAVPFVVPDMAALAGRLSAAPHPRSLPDAATLAQMAGQRTLALAALRWQAGTDPQPPAAGAQGDGFRYGEMALKSLMAYAYDGTGAGLQDARLRVLNLAAWDPRGPTALDDRESTFVAWVAALGYDWLGPALDDAARAALGAMLRARIGDLYGWVSGVNGWPYGESYVPPPLWRHPRDSHRAYVAAMVGVMSTLLLGDVPEAQRWLDDLLPYVLNTTSPWGGEGGGYANGTAYALWDIGSQLSAWYALRRATCGNAQTCIDLARKAWVRNFGAFLAYFMPPTYAADPAVQAARARDPGTPIGLFGDGFADPQLLEERARFAKGYTYFAPSALGCWYAQRLAGEDYTRIEYLMAPPDPCPPQAPLPAATPGSLYLPAIGWMAMHSDLSDLDRTSVYFKSSPSPFGAYNHQAADQNAFVINSGGERLAIESGYYDGYGTRHWQYWVKRTRSKNAVTYDGGHGQHAVELVPLSPDQAPQYARIRYGRIIQQQSAPGYDIVAGDATDAYNDTLSAAGPLSRAVRSLVYLRPDTIVQYDSLASATPRTWEWNIHALDPISVIYSGSRVLISRGSRSLCVDALAGPGGGFVPVAAPDFGSWGATGGVSDAPNAAAPAEYHGKFASAQASTAVEFIALLRVNAACNDTPPRATHANGVWSVTVDGRTVSFDSSTGLAAVN
jgi:hypothetical protein